ncbi:MAG: OFA family MFS transporter, partial [bacterium]|nr:OFA family MFS transporter [bacterium]
MSEQDLTQKSHANQGWRVVFAAVGINLALGILYTWSVIAGGIPEKWGWDASDKAWPYAVACLVFSLVMVPAGRMQDKLGPRLVASLGGVLVGAGMIAASFTDSTLGFILGFGVLAGAGIGFGYASATPPSVKWFPSAKTGMIAGIVVSGFGLASVYAAPLARWLIATYELQIAMRTLGIAFLVVVVGLAQFLRVPHKVEQLVRGLGRAGELKAGANALVKKENFTPGEMMKTWQFWALWFMYACGAGAGLMIISVAKKLGASVNVGTSFVV